MFGLLEGVLLQDFDEMILTPGLPGSCATITFVCSGNNAMIGVSRLVDFVFIARGIDDVMLERIETAILMYARI